MTRDSIGSLPGYARFYRARPSKGIFLKQKRAKSKHATLIQYGERELGLPDQSLVRDAGRSRLRTVPATVLMCMFRFRSARTQESHFARLPRQTLLISRNKKGYAQNK